MQYTSIENYERPLTIKIPTFMGERRDSARKKKSSFGSILARISRKVKRNTLLKASAYLAACGAILASLTLLDSLIGIIPFAACIGYLWLFCYVNQEVL